MTKDHIGDILASEPFHFTTPKNGRRKDGFAGERSVVLPPALVEMAARDALVSSLYVTDIGYYPMAEHHYRSRDVGIGEYVLIYCVNGSGWYRLRGQERHVTRDQYFILPAGVPHAYGADQGAEGWTIYWVHFRGTHAATYADGATEPQTIRVAENSRIRTRIDIFEELLSTMQFGESIEDLRYASSLLQYFLASMRYLQQYRFSPGKHGPTTGKPSGGDFGLDVVEAAIHFMRENIERHVALKDVLNYVGYSQSHFSTLFRQRTGKSPGAYINQLKMDYACHLLQVTDLKVNQICFKVGIEDPYYFSRLFTKTIGLSPTDYRTRADK